MDIINRNVLLQMNKSQRSWRKLGLRINVIFVLKIGGVNTEDPDVRVTIRNKTITICFALKDR